MERRAGAPFARKPITSRFGGAPTSRAYSRLNCDGADRLRRRGCRSECDVGARGADGVAHPPARPDADHDIRCWPSPSVGMGRSRRFGLATSSGPRLAKHWHGAAPTTALTDIAFQEKLDGTPVACLEHVTPEQYEGRCGEASRLSEHA